MAAHPGPPFPRTLLHPGLWVAEVVYRPLETELLRTARERRLPHAGRRRDGGASRPPTRSSCSPARRPTASGCCATSPTLGATPRREGGRDERCGRVDRHRLPQRDARREARAPRRGAGFDGIELFEDDLHRLAARPRRGARAGRRARPRDRPLPAVSRLRGRPAERARRATCAARRPSSTSWRQLGAATLLVCSNVAADAIDDDALAAEQLHTLAERAAERGLRIAYEALAWGRHVSEYDHAWRIVRRADHPALGTCLDSFHILSRGTDLADDRRDPGREDLLPAAGRRPAAARWTSCSGAATTAASLARAASTSRASRSACSRAGYDGPLSLEVFNDVFRQADPDRTAIDAMRSLLVLEEAGAAARAAAARPPRSTGSRSSSSASTRRGAPRPRRCWRRWASRTPAATAPSRSQLWEQRRRARPGQPRRPAGDPRMGALAVESRGPRAVGRAGERRCSPRPARAARPGEADLPRSPHPTGRPCSSVAPTPRTPTGCDDFAALPWEPRATAPRGRPHRSPRAVAALRLLRRGGALLPLGPRAGAAARAASSPRPTGWCAAARAAAPTAASASRSTSRCSPAARTAGLQHIALATDDAIAPRARAARAGRRAAARSRRTTTTTSPPASSSTRRLTRHARARRALRPRRATASSCTSTPPRSAARLFFELVERRGGYAGYGAVNSPVRMAAQRALSPLPSHTEHPRRRAVSAMPSPMPQGACHESRPLLSEDAAQGGARQLDRQRARVLRLLHLRDGRGARVRQGLLPGLRPRDGHPALARHLRRRLCRPPDRRVLHGPSRRPATGASAC